MPLKNTTTRCLAVTLTTYLLVWFYLLPGYLDGREITLLYNFPNVKLKKYICMISLPGENKIVQCIYLI